MAYKVALTIKCDNSFCIKHARFEVFNKFNSLMGKYCPSCALRKVKELNENEEHKEKNG